MKLVMFAFLFPPAATSINFKNPNIQVIPKIPVFPVIPKSQ